jgi:hypothetical protein
VPIIHHRSDDRDVRRALEALGEEHLEGFSAIFLTNEQAAPDRERLDREYGRLNSDVLVVEFSNDVALNALKLLPDAPTSSTRTIWSTNIHAEIQFQSEKGPIKVADVLHSVEHWPPVPPDADTKLRYKGLRVLVDPYVNCRFKGYDQIEDEDDRKLARAGRPA